MGIDFHDICIPIHKHADYAAGAEASSIRHLVERCKASPGVQQAGAGA
jgi:hypothetical protein